MAPVGCRWAGAPFRRMLAILDDLAEDALRGELDPAEAEGAVDFFCDFADRCHHGKEERELFPAIEKAGLPREGGPLGIMLEEHEQGRAAIRAMAGDLARLRTGERGAAPISPPRPGATRTCSRRT